MSSYVSEGLLWKTLEAVNVVSMREQMNLSSGYAAAREAVLVLVERVYVVRDLYQIHYHIP